MRDDPGVNHDELVGQVRVLRAEGRSPKEIARTLGLRPAAIAPLIRAIAAQAEADASEPGIAGCWVSPGWSAGLQVADYPDWPDAHLSESAASGLATVFLARQEPNGKLSVCGWLVDVYCLGVKDVLGPDVIDRSALNRYRRTYFSAYGGESLRAPVELARHLVLGAVDFARDLGFEPARGFEKTVDHLGPWDGPSAIGFGLKGKPFYIQGPYDNAHSIMKTLGRSQGRDNFHFLAQV